MFRRESEPGSRLPPPPVAGSFTYAAYRGVCSERGFACFKSAAPPYLAWLLTYVNDQAGGAERILACSKTTSGSYRAVSARTRMSQPVGAERVQACSGTTSGTYPAVSGTEAGHLKNLGGDCTKWHFGVVSPDFEHHSRQPTYFCKPWPVRVRQRRGDRQQAFALVMDSNALLR